MPKDSKNPPSMGTPKSLGLCLWLEMICCHRTCLSLVWQSYMSPSPGLVLGLVHNWLLASLGLVFHASFPYCLLSWCVHLSHSHRPLPSHTCSCLPVRPDVRHRPFTANTCHSLRLCDLVLVPTAPFPQQLSRWLFQIPVHAHVSPHSSRDICSR